MKNLKSILAIAIIAILASCSKSDDVVATTPTPAAIVVNNKLQLPAIFENNTLLVVPDATQNTGVCGANVNVGMAESIITITKDGIINDPTKVNIDINISDVFAGEVVIQLIDPSGASCALIKRVGTIATNNNTCGWNGDFVTGNILTFNSSMNNNPLTPPLIYTTGNYSPQFGLSDFPTTVPTVVMSTFLQGKNIKGIWKIKAYDYGVGDILKLHSWKLRFDVGALQ